MSLIQIEPDKPFSCWKHVNGLYRSIEKCFLYLNTHIRVIFLLIYIYLKKMCIFKLCQSRIMIQMIQISIWMQIIKIMIWLRIITNKCLYITEKSPRICIRKLHYHALSKVRICRPPAPPFFNPSCYTGMNSLIRSDNCIKSFHIKRCR